MKKLLLALLILGSVIAVPTLAQAAADCCNGGSCCTAGAGCCK